MVRGNIYTNDNIIIKSGSDWKYSTNIIPDGAIAYDRDNKILKNGNGRKTWNDIILSEEANKPIYAYHRFDAGAVLLEYFKEHPTKPEYGLHIVMTQDENGKKFENIYWYHLGKFELIMGSAESAREVEYTKPEWVENIGCVAGLVILVSLVVFLIAGGGEWLFDNSVGLFFVIGIIYFFFIRPFTK